MSSEKFGFIPAIARRWGELMVGFGVSVAVGLAPFLGVLDVPAFAPLLSLFPKESRIPLIPISAIVMGMVAAGVQFYANERIVRRYLRKRFPILVVVLLVSVVALLLLHTFVVPIGSSKERVFIGWSRLPGCECGPISDSECVAGLAQDLGTCWSESSIRWVKNSYYLTYLLVTGGFGALIGLLVLQMKKVDEQEAKKTQQPPTSRTSAQSKTQSVAPADAAAPEPTAPPPTGEAQ